MQKTKSLLTIHCRNTSNRDLSHYPVTYGVPLPEGALTDTEHLAIRVGDGALRPLQVKPLEHWLDGSIKWMRLDFDLPLERNTERAIDLVRCDAPLSDDGVAVQATPDRITVTTPLLSAMFERKKFSLLASCRVNGREMMVAGSDIIVETPRGKRFYASNAGSPDVRVAEAGPQRVVIEARGRHTAGDGAEMLDFRVRYTFRPHAPGIALAYKFTNREAPETGVHLASIRMVLPVALGDHPRYCIRQSHSGENWVSRLHTLSENVELFSGSGAPDSERHGYGKLSDGVVAVRNLDNFRENLGDYPHYLRPGNARTDQPGGLRQAYPYIGMQGDNGSLVGWFSEMSYHVPKAIRADRNVLTFDLWPAWAGDLHFRQGMSKEHELYLSPSESVRSHEAMEAIYFDHEILDERPVTLTLDPAYVRDCRVLQLHRWLRYNEDRYLPVEMKLGSAAAKAGVGQRGIIDYGDHITADRSWALNNQDDTILNQTREYYRRAEPSMLRSAWAMARHNAHIDFIAYDPGNPLRGGTMPAHCPEHTDGAAYPSHMWLDGLLAVYCITGDDDLRAAALSVGENMLRWQAARSIFYCDSRECGWPMLAYLRLYEHTHDRKWLDAADEVFRFFVDKIDQNGEILWEYPQGIGTKLTGYGEFITWRAMFFMWELTGRDDVRDFLVKCVTNPKIYRYRPVSVIANPGWACNDLFPSWAASVMTGDDRYMEENYPFLRFLMSRQERFPWGGNDMHFYLGELDRRDKLAAFCS